MHPVYIRCRQILLRMVSGTGQGVLVFNEDSFVREVKIWEVDYVKVAQQ